jgi:hypothetical protein
MTVCIAAISYKDQCIVTASDFMLSLDWASKDTQTIKLQPLCPSGRWVAMFSGNPTVDAHVIKVASDTISSTGKETSADVVKAVEKAFRDELKRKIEGELLSPYGLDRDTFLREGFAGLGEHHFNRLASEIASVRLDTSFLIAGYEPDNGAPKLISAADPGTHEYHNSLGFCAIGAGWAQALGSLYNTYKPDLSRDDLIYRICEAKFLSESALGVGKRTVVLIVAPDGSHKGLYPEFVEPIREIWLRQGRPPVPQDFYTKVKGTIHEIKWSKGPPPRS